MSYINLCHQTRVSLVCCANRCWTYRYLIYQYLQPNEYDAKSGQKEGIVNVVRHLKFVGTESLWPSAMFNRSRRKRNPTRHSTYAHVSLIVCNRHRRRRWGGGGAVYNLSERFYYDYMKIGSTYSEIANYWQCCFSDGGVGSPIPFRLKSPRVLTDEVCS